MHTIMMAQRAVHHTSTHTQTIKNSQHVCIIMHISLYLTAAHNSAWTNKQLTLLSTTLLVWNVGEACQWHVGWLPTTCSW